jgi:UDP-glucose 4-epimerase
MKKVLITGNSGYIGTHLTNLLKDEYEVYGLDVNPNQLPVVHQYNVDIRRPFDITEEFDAVVHLAALVNVGESEKMPISYYITNLTGTMNVINKIKTKNFIFSSTGAAQACESAYGVSKRAAEDVIREYCTQHRKQDYTIFRFYNVIGSTVAKPTNPDGLFYNLIKAKDTGSFTIYGNDYPNTNDGTCVRDYVHVEEICHALREAIEKPSNSIECLGHGVGYTVREMAEKFQKVNDCNFNIVSGPRRKGDIEYYVLEDVSPYMKNLYTIEDLLKVQSSHIV